MTQICPPSRKTAQERSPDPRGKSQCLILIDSTSLPVRQFAQPRADDDREQTVIGLRKKAAQKVFNVPEILTHCGGRDRGRQLIKGTGRTVFPSKRPIDRTGIKYLGSQGAGVVDAVGKKPAAKKDLDDRALDRKSLAMPGDPGCRAAGIEVLRCSLTHSAASASEGRNEIGCRRMMMAAWCR